LKRAKLEVELSTVDVSHFCAAIESQGSRIISISETEESLSLVGVAIGKGSIEIRTLKGELSHSRVVAIKQTVLGLCATRRGRQSGAAATRRVAQIQAQVIR